MSDIDYSAILPDGWQRARGYSYAVLSQGQRSLHIAGQIAAKDGRSIAEGMDMGGQWGQALGNVATLVRAAGGEPEHIVAIRVYVTDIDAFNAAGKAIGAAWAEHLGRHFPAMTLVEVTRLIDPHAVVEIEAEAVLP
tara:strand:- start:58 stop:468 length:411 start_codon:yes stop_codon:yes gene_type:complete